MGRGVRRLAALMLLTAAMALVGMGAGYAAPAELTIIFRTGTGCSSIPDVGSLTIQAGTRVDLVNRTGYQAMLDVGRRGQQPVDDGSDYLAHWPPGQYQVRMVPLCTGALVTPASVTVLGEATASPTTDSPPVPVRVTPIGSTSRADHPWNTGPTSGAPPLFTHATGAPGRSSGTSASVPTLVEAYVPPEHDDGGGVRLVAIVALICICGVTVGIIRAIRTQRTTNAQRASWTEYARR